MASQSHYKGDRTIGKTIKSEKDSNGKKTVKLQPTALDIIWGSDSRYWRIIEQGDAAAAELLQVCWLEVNGWIELKHLSRDVKYKVSFNVSLKADAFGWHGSPVFLMARVGTGQFNWSNFDLHARTQAEGHDGTQRFDIPEKLIVQIPSDASEDTKLYFGLYEIWRGRWKGGLVIHEVNIAPIPPP